MIFISAGHHREKRGACYGGFCEFPETALWADAIVKYLPMTLGYRVPNGYLRTKAAYINRLCPDGRGIALEVHFNAAVDGYGNNIGDGALTLHYPGSTNGIKTAQSVQKAILKSFGPDRGIREGYYRLNPNNGVNFFLRKIIAPAIIIEPQFIHHKTEIVAKREECCKDIALALTHTCRELFNVC